jgi:hypothetical protein
MLNGYNLVFRVLSKDIGLGQTGHLYRQYETDFTRPYRPKYSFDMFPLDRVLNNLSKNVL